MSSTQVRTNAAARSKRSPHLGAKLEVVVIPLSDVDPAKTFYERVVWTLDSDIAAGEFPGRPAHGAGHRLHRHVRQDNMTAAAADSGLATASDLAGPLRRAAVAHREHEIRARQADAKWPAWYVGYMTREQTQTEFPS
jgi:hypothetical protein